MRLKLLIISTLIFQLNIIAQGKKIIPEKILNEVQSLFNDDQKYRDYIYENKKNISDTVKDSLWNLQIKIDYKNIKRLIEIVNEHGYFSSSNSNSKVGIYAMFMHTPRELIEEVRFLIEKEKKKGNINEASYGMISWHLKGRPRPLIIPTQDKDKKIFD